MGKVKRNRHSLKWKFLLYMPVCFIIALAGSFGIGVVTNYFQDWYRYNYPELKLSDSYYELHISEDNHTYVVYTDRSGEPVQPFDPKRQATYWIIQCPDGSYPYMDIFLHFNGRNSVLSS